MQTNSSDSLKRLEELLERIEKHGVRSLNCDEVLEFGPLYRRAVSALSVARSQGIDDTRIQYLNGLVSRAYGHVYVADSKGWPSVTKFFTEEFPRCFRRNLQFITVSFLISLIAMLFAWGIVRQDPGKADVVFGQNATEMIDAQVERHTGHKNWMPGEERPIMSGFIITNNIKVSIMVFVYGITAGIGTVLLLGYNGLMLGVIGAGVASRSAHVALSFWSFVAPHGVIELTAIFISGGAGLLIAWAILNPGCYSRRVALKLAGREAFTLMLGVAAMLVVAGLIEGFFSPSMLPYSLKLSVAAVLGILEYSYLFMAGRKKKGATR